MSKKLKYIFGAILSLLVLGGCREEMPSLGEASTAETSSETVTETSSAVTTAVPAKIETETSTVTSEDLETTAERDDISEEQAALEKLILDTAENKEEYTIQSPLFGDFDEDGINELVAVLSNQDEVKIHELNGSLGEIWFASGNMAYSLHDYSALWGKPYILKTCGQTVLNLPSLYNSPIGGGDELTYSFRIKNSETIEIESILPHGLWLDGEYGDFTTSQMSMDGFSSEEGHLMGRTWKTYWCYYSNNKISVYYGKEISKEEFLKYDGAKEFLDDLENGGYTLDNILKRGNGVINVNYSKRDDKYNEVYFDNATLLYRNGKVIEKETDSGIYDPCFADLEKTEQTDFERFSEMIYDTAEGDENSFIRERFYGDTDKDGKNELYAYYGTDENFSLWFADDSGAKKVTEDIKLFYADGDVLMKNGDDYFVMKNGKSKKLAVPDVEDFSVQADGSFTGYITSGYADSTRSDVIRQLYWFRYKDGKISDYTGLDITEEEFLQYGGGRAFLDEVAARGGDLVNIVRRENGIININYALHNQTVTNRFFMTLEIGADNKLTDITPKNEDGTPDNAGWYLHSLSIASSK